MVEIHGEKLPDHTGEDSVSFLAVLKGEQKEDKVRGAVIHHSDKGYYALRMDQWKLIFHEKAGSRRTDPKVKPVINPREIQLFDMSNDFKELVNVAKDHPQVVKSMTLKMKEIVEEGRSNKGKAQPYVPYEEKYLETVKAFL